MENEKLNQAVKEIKDIKMTSLEKEDILKNILNSPLKNNTHIRSPYFLHKSKVVYASVLCALVLMLSAGTALAGKSLPGSIFYPLKVSVFEPARGALTFSLIKKIQHETNLATERIVEAEVLADRNLLDDAKVDQLNALLERHIKTFNTVALNLREQTLNDDEFDDDIITNFQAQMNAHARLLELISEREAEENGKSAAVKTNPENSPYTKISKTARENAVKARSTVNTKDDKISDKYQQRKTKVSSLIDSTHNNLKDVVVDQSPRKKKIIEDTNKTLDQAKKLLKEVEEDDKAGNFKNAYDKLLDSESSAKEANILFKAGLGL